MSIGRGTAAPYFKSLNQSFNVLGVDNQLFYLFVGLCLPIAFSAHLSPLMDVIAILVFIFLYVIGVLITRVDNQMLAIYRRHIHYKKYYRAHSTIYTISPLIKPSVPYYLGKRSLV